MNFISLKIGETVRRDEILEKQNKNHLLEKKINMKMDKVSFYTYIHAKQLTKAKE